MMKHVAPTRRLFFAVLFVCAAGCVAEDPGEHRIVPKEQVAVRAEGAPESATPEAQGDLGPVERGRQLYTGKGICHACHGPEAQGTQIAPDLTDDEWLHFTEPVTQEKLVALIQSGVQNPIEHPGAMPPRGGAPLTDAEIEAVAAYVLSL